MDAGRYVDAQGTWVDVLAVGNELGGTKKIVIYHDGKVSKGRCVNYACPLSELKKRKLRPIQDSDYGPGGPAAYYAEMMGT